MDQEGWDTCLSGFTHLRAGSTTNRRQRLVAQGTQAAKERRCYGHPPRAALEPVHHPLTRHGRGGGQSAWESALAAETTWRRLWRRRRRQFCGCRRLLPGGGAGESCDHQSACRTRSVANQGGVCCTGAEQAAPSVAPSRCGATHGLRRWLCAVCGANARRSPAVANSDPLSIPPGPAIPQALLQIVSMHASGAMASPTRCAAQQTTAASLRWRGGRAGGGACGQAS